ncbi:hypothetical protein [Nocardia africana]|uniref:Mce-associated membrane protein n=1 Tax=Nocardia africana TaxID=134964 RepID=A0A378WLB0_9NOCA|nr:hypothetical protein [Nocardia africana]MCC3316123.1 hypothetical protein [Nocardia africana]SUA41537.1 Uncharacterised protein [Nocardia africana]
MSESNSTPTGRVRRRASRQAGAPTEAIAVERTESAPAADATVKLGTGSAEAEAAAATSKPGTADETVKLATASPERGKSSGSGKESSSEIVSDTTADAAAEDEPAPPKRSLGPLGWAAAVVAVLSLILLVGSGGFFAYHQHQVSTQADQRAEYEQTAKQAILNLTNIKDDTAKQDIDRVLSVASGQLKQEYSERKDAYAQVVQQAKVKASGEIIETAVESQDDHTAKVLVAAKQTLTNAGAKDPQERYYRFRVTVDRADNGGITASQVEFVA